jgi:hypothetical protein
MSTRKCGGCVLAPSKGGTDCQVGKAMADKLGIMISWFMSSLQVASNVSSLFAGPGAE